MMMKTDKEMILRDVEWPAFPGLPVKKYSKNPGEFPDCGIIIAGDLQTVYFINMWLLVSGPIRPQLEKVERKNYESLDALLEDGWIVD